MNQQQWKALNWLDRYEVQQALEGAGYYVGDDEPTTELQLALAEAVECGDVDPSILDGPAVVPVVVR